MQSTGSCELHQPRSSDLARDRRWKYIPKGNTVITHFPFASFKTWLKKWDFTLSHITYIFPILEYMYIAFLVSLFFSYFFSFFFLLSWSVYRTMNNIPVHALPFSRHARDSTPSNPYFLLLTNLQEWLSRTPLGREGTGEDVAEAVVFLASPAAAYITGSSINVCGGRSVMTWGRAWSDGEVAWSPRSAFVFLLI